MSVCAADLRIRISPDLAAILRQRLHVAPDLAWRICDIESYGGQMVVRVEEDIHVDWDPTNEWGGDDDEAVDEELVRRITTPARVPRWSIFRRG